MGRHQGFVYFLETPPQTVHYMEVGQNFSLFIKQLERGGHQASLSSQHFSLAAKGWASPPRGNVIYELLKWHLTPGVFGVAS